MPADTSPTSPTAPPFVPGEVCCLVAIPGRLGARRLRVLHGDFAAACNAVFPELLDRQAREAGRRPGTLLRELTPERVARLRGALAGSDWLLAPPPSRRLPYTRLWRHGETLAMFRYRLGTGAALAADQVAGGPPELAARAATAPPVAGRAAAVLDLVLLAKLSLAPLNAAIAGALATAGVPATMRAMVPNWLLSTSPPEPHIEGGPGSLPEPADPPASGAFVFEDAPELGAAPSGPAAVRVAILDTCPTAAELKLAQKRFPKNRLLAEVGAALALDEAPAHAPEAFQEVAELHVSRVTDATPTVVDHGLFVAGIVHSIARGAARLSLVQVLSDRGVGTLMHLLEALARLPSLRAASGEQHLVVNLSLVSEIPPHAVLAGWFLPVTAADPEAMLRDLEDVARLLDSLSLPLRETVDWLAARDVLVVAAAGNRGRRVEGGGARHAPQTPAAFDSVLAVAATDLANRSAEFSNRGDIIVMGNGVATYGGNAGPGGQLVLAGTAGRPRFDAPVGLYTAYEVGAGAAPNRTGWAFWAGTSFATPIITGLAARLWQADPTLSARQVMDAVRGLSRPLESAGDLDVPVVRVRQKG